MATKAHPTIEQIESVIQEIERLQQDQSARPMWPEMTRGEKVVALEEIEFAGFSRDQELKVIGRVLAGEPEEMWMLGIVDHDAAKRKGRQDDLVADFHSRIDDLKRDGVPDYPPLGNRLPWSEATEERKLENVVWESMSVWLDGNSPGSISVPDAVRLDAVEANVDYAKLPSDKRETLIGLRARVDSGQPVDIASELERVAGVDFDDEPLANPPQMTPEQYQRELHSQRDEQANIRLIEKGVDYGKHEILDKDSGVSQMGSPSNELPEARMERQIAEQRATMTDRSEAGKLRQLEGNVDWDGIDDKQKEAGLHSEVDFSKIAREQLNSVYEDVARDKDDEVDERPGRRLFDSANFERAKQDTADYSEQLANVRDTTRNLIESVLEGSWPRAGALVDFGIDSKQHYEALHFAIRSEEIMPSVLDAAMGHGAKLTELTREAPSNPHKDISFHTSWDVLLDREPPNSPEKSKSPYDRRLDEAAANGVASHSNKDRGMDR